MEKVIKNNMATEEKVMRKQAYSSLCFGSFLMLVNWESAMKAGL